MSTATRTPYWPMSILTAMGRHAAAVAHIAEGVSQTSTYLLKTQARTGTAWAGNLCGIELDTASLADAAAAWRRAATDAADVLAYMVNTGEDDTYRHLHIEPHRSEHLHKGFVLAAHSSRGSDAVFVGEGEDLTAYRLAAYSVHT